MIINICLIVIIIITIVMISIYNRFVRTNNSINESTSAIDVLLKQRFDLLPNIIECVKGYAKHEKSTFEELAKLRSSYNDSSFSVKKAEEMSKKFAPIMALSENYPELKANEQFLSLQNNLINIENRLNNVRILYNNRVTKYNNLVESVPSNIIAKIFGFEKKDLFKIAEEEKKNIKVSL